MKTKKRKLGKRGYDPAWVYLVGGATCLAFVVFYAMFGDHTGGPAYSPRSGPHVRTPFETYLVTIGLGIGLIVVGVWKLMRSKKDPDRG
jgi:hypothetical protein